MGGGCTTNYNFYSENEQEIMMRDVNRMRLPHLLITADMNIDNAIIAASAKENIAAVSFIQAYLQHCEIMMHNLGS